MSGAAPAPGSQARRDEVEPDDIVMIVGRRSALLGVQGQLGAEVPLPEGAQVAVTSKDAVLLNKQAVGQTVEQLRSLAAASALRGVFIKSIRRIGRSIPTLPGTVVAKGDVVTLYGSEAAIDKAIAIIGQPLPATSKTDFVFLGAGIVAGLFLGGLSLKLGGLNLTLGTGGGALIAGLVFGWLHMRYPQRGSLPVPAAEFIKEFGLATFIAAVGMSAGPEAIRLIAQFGLILPVLGILISIVPGLVSLFVGSKLFHIEAPVLLGAIAGQHCSTPAITALVSQSGSTIPVTGYTVTYAISNVLLPLMGPIVVGIAVALP